MSVDVALTLLQFVGLTLPAVAILMDFMFDRRDLINPSDQDAANYQNMRLSIVFLIFAAIADLTYIFAVQTSVVFYLSGIFVGLGLFHLSLAIVLQEIGLSMIHTILWPYRNTWHHLRDFLRKLN